jgi:hypothetical protein
LIDETVWVTREIKSWQSFVNVASLTVDTDPGANVPAYLYRGQPDSSWELSPTLLRNLSPQCSPEQALKIESEALAEFKAQAHLYYQPSDLPQDDLGASLFDWWALMQHHGAPTRLLDWTSSPYVAAYFAVDQCQEKPGAIFIVHPATATSAFETSFPGGVPGETIMSPGAPNLIFFRTPLKKTPRLVAQRGEFSCSVNILGRHDELMCEACRSSMLQEPKTIVILRWILPAHLKPKFSRQLRAMNVAAHSLFPGLDGLGRSVAEVVRTMARG